MPDDVHAHAVRAHDARGLPVVVRRRADQGRRDHPVAHGVLRSVHVGEEPLERAHPLRDARLDHAPVGCRDDPRHGVERERPLLAGEVERDALREVRARQRIGATAQLLLRHPRERRVELAVRLAHLAGLGGEHLVPRASGASPLPPRPRRGVPVEERSHGLTVPVVGYRDVTDTRRARHPSPVGSSISARSCRDAASARGSCRARRRGHRRRLTRRVAVRGRALGESERTRFLDPCNPLTRVAGPAQGRRVPMRPPCRRTIRSSFGPVLQSRREKS